ncbi:MAG TPA: hypothetical protein VHG29_13305 [Novosphingobium sp.]|nr:hypothetical protein [Novosphingobium sp.]
MVRKNIQLAAVLALALLLGAAPALAEKLSFDHRLSPPLKAVLDSHDPAMIDYNDKNPRHVVDVIAVRGQSASDWTEALVIRSRLPDRRVRTAPDWMAEIRAEAGRGCRSEFNTIAEDANSVTFERHSSGCAANYPPVGIYRVVAGQRSLFMLAVVARDGIGAEARRQWLDLLASARIE